MKQEWPNHKNNEVVSVVIEEQIGTQCFRYREDGTISMCFNPELLAKAEVPGYVKQAAIQPGSMLVTREGRQLLRRLFDQADALEAS